MSVSLLLEFLYWKLLTGHTKKIMDVFGVSEHIVCKAHKLCSGIGILAVSEPKRGKSLPADIAQLVETFYQDDSTWLRKDYVNIKCNIHLQTPCAT